MKTFLLFLLTTVSLSANDKFYQANEAFQKGKYDQVIEILESYKDFSFARFMNLGHAYLQKNDENLQTVKAVLSPNCLLTDVGNGRFKKAFFRKQLFSCV